jgi:hypothetical protein
VARTSVIALAAMRIGIGALAWVRPDLAARLFGLPAPDGHSPYLWRLFGIRDVVVGIGTLTSTGAGRRAWTTFGLVCDASDGAAAAIGGANGELPRDATLALVAVPAAAVGLGAIALWPRRD